jgi:hypothetical protein
VEDRAVPLFVLSHRQGQLPPFVAERTVAESAREVTAP